MYVCSSFCFVQMFCFVLFLDSSGWEYVPGKYGGSTVILLVGIITNDLHTISNHVAVPSKQIARTSFPGSTNQGSRFKTGDISPKV